MKTLHAACSAELNDGLESDLAECLHYERERARLPPLPPSLSCMYLGQSVVRFTGTRICPPNASTAKILAVEAGHFSFLGKLDIM